MKYKELYDFCHKNGYMEEHDLGWSQGFFNLFESLSIEYENIVDVGCSIGNGVKLFNDNNKKCDGVDVSEIAVNYGIKRGLNLYCSSCTSLPFKDGTYDVVVSSDMLEHLEPEDVDKGINELFRVSKKYVALKIPTFKEPQSYTNDQKWKDKFNELGVIENNLHLTVLSHIEWREKILKNQPSVFIVFDHYITPARCFITVFAKKTDETILNKKKSECIDVLQHYANAIKA